MASPLVGDPKHASVVLRLNQKLQQCWELDVNWDLFPQKLREGCHQVGKGISMPATAVLAGLLLVVSFSMSHSVVEVQGTDWAEPVLLWIAVLMPTGMGKSPLCKFLRNLIKEARKHRGLDGTTSSWLCDDQSFEKMGDLMSQNQWKLFGLYDELTMFLSQINVFRGRGVTDSHELSVFLQLYGAEQWVRRTVSGEANFAMEHTGLTVGGFVQPVVAQNIVQTQANVDKGLCQRFLWLAPKPTAVAFEDLQQVDREFSSSIVGLMSSIWVCDRTARKWTLTRPCELFREKYDSVKEQLLKISCMDDLLSGMLSKSRGQVLRVAATLHVLFHLDTPLSIPDNISEAALRAAVNFVEVCVQHAAYIAGRGNISESIEALEEVHKEAVGGKSSNTTTCSNAAYSLLLPGKVLHLSALNVQRKFRDRGNKAGAKDSWRLLSERGLGELKEFKARRGTDILYEFHKCAIPDEQEEMAVFAEKLAGFGVSLEQYKCSLLMEDITMESITARKKGKQPGTPRRSPRVQRQSYDVPPSPKSRKVLEL